MKSCGTVCIAGSARATCPTYQVLGDELDSPRGRIYLIKDMLENERVPDDKTVKHIDRCLSCLACMTTCPSGRSLHASGRSRARIYRGKLQASLFGSGLALASGTDFAVSYAVPMGFDRRETGASISIPDAGRALEGHAGHGTQENSSRSVAMMTRKASPQKENRSDAWP